MNLMRRKIIMITINSLSNSPGDGNIAINKMIFMNGLIRE